MWRFGLNLRELGIGEQRQTRAAVPIASASARDTRPASTSSAENERLLLEPRTRTIEQMRLTNGLRRFVDLSGFVA